MTRYSPDSSGPFEFGSAGFGHDAPLDADFTPTQDDTSGSEAAGDDGPAFGAAIDAAPAGGRSKRRTKKTASKTRARRKTKPKPAAEPQLEPQSEPEAGAIDDPAEPAEGARPRKRASKPRTRRSRAKASEDQASSEATAELTDEQRAVEELAQRARKDAEGGTEDRAGDGAEDGAGDAAAESGTRRRSRRGSRGRSRRDEQPEDERDAPDAEAADDSGDGAGSGGEGAGDGEDDGAPRRKRRRGTRGGRRRKRGGTKSDAEANEAAVEADEAPAAARKKRSSRTGKAAKGRGRAAAEGPATLGLDSIPGEDDDIELEDSLDGEGAHKAVVGTKHRRGRSRKKRVVEEESDGAKRKVSGRRKRGAEDSDDEPESGSKKRGRRRRGGKASSEERDDQPAPEPVRDQMILVNAHDPEETRVVCVENDRIVDLQMTVDHHKSFVNDIYRGRVVNLETNIGAAFVDFGQGKNGFLHLSDVMDFYGEEDFSLDRLLEARTDEEEWENRGSAAGDADANADSNEDDDGADEEDDEGGSKSRSKRSKSRSRTSKKGSKKKTAKQQSRPRRGRSRRGISDLLSKGQLVVCQITKDAIGDKGPTLTTFISIPGRYLVLMPSLQRTGVSRKIEDDKERRRLKRILQGLEIPDNMGVIVRTAGVGKTKADIKRDLDYLLAVWKQFSKQLVLGRAPAPLYQESDVAIRTMRDMFSSRTKAVVVDDEAVYEKMREFTQKLMPEHLDRIELHDAAKPLFHHYGIEPDFEKIFSRRVELPSGGSIVIDQTEALVAIDVNSGRTRSESAGFEDIALKTNLEAVPEIARQIKLRDMGGILVLDFIDMMRASSRRKVENAFRDCLAGDRARSKVGRISQFGLLELTRQRLGPGLSKLVYEPCSTCRGSGRRRTAQSRAQALLRRLASALTQKGFTRIEIQAHPDTIQWIRKHDAKELKELEDSSKRELNFKSVENQVEDSIFHYLRADGREVRPGGRRKR